MTRAPDFDIALQSSQWEAEALWRDILRRVVDAVWVETGQDNENAEVSFVLGDDTGIRRLNAAYRDKDSATNVLSFPSGDAAVDGDAPVLLGDVVFAYETIAQEATQQRKSLENHFTHLAVHGMLHLLGFDHESDEEAKVMESLEITLLDRFGIPDPYQFQQTAAE